MSKRLRMTTRFVEGRHGFGDTAARLLRPRLFELAEENRAALAQASELLLQDYAEDDQARAARIVELEAEILALRSQTNRHGGRARARDG